MHDDGPTLAAEADCHLVRDVLVEE